VAAMRMTLTLTDGNFEGARRVVKQQFERGQHANPRLAYSIVGVQAAMIELAVGEPEGVAKSLQAFVDSADGLLTWRAPLALALARCGRHAEAADSVEPLVRVGFEPRHRDFLPMVLATFAEGIQIMGHRHYAQIVGDELAQLSDRCVVLGLCLATYGAVDRYRGLCAETLGDFDRASDFSARGLELDEEMSSPPFVASGLRDLGRALRGRCAAGDAERSKSALQRARALALGMGMQHVVDSVDALEA